jgi:hypothetical protein
MNRLYEEILMMASHMHNIAQFGGTVHLDLCSLHIGLKAGH